MHFDGAARGRGGDRVPARRRRAVGDAPQGVARGAAASRSAPVEHSRRSPFARALAQRARRAAVLRRARRSGDWPLWRVSTAPARGAEFAAMLPRGAQWFYDWAGGLIWIALPPSDDAGAAAVRRAVRDAGGHATLVRAPAAVARRGRRVRAAGRRARGRDQAGQGELRSQGRAQSGPHVGGGVMQTTFSLAQLADPNIAEADKILRACVHCGFCTATCPTYVLLGDELDSPARPHLPDQGDAGARPRRRRRTWSSTSTAACRASPA